MRSLSLVRMPCFRRCSMISTTSPNHEGVEGTECEEVWMLTEESAILVMCTSLLGKMCILPQERHILCLLATNYISLRNSWEWMRGPCACPGWGATILPHGTPTNRRARRTSTRPNTFQIGKKEGQADTGRPFLTYYRQKNIAWSRTERITSRCIGYATWSKLTR